MVTTRRHPLKFYGTLILMVVFFFGMAAIVGLISYDEITDKHNDRAYFLPLLAALCVVYCIYGVIKYFKNTPIISIDNFGITFDSGSTYAWSELEEIELTGKNNFSFIPPYPMESVKLKFKGEAVRYIFDSMYSNIWEIKSFIKHTIIDKKPYGEYDIMPVANAEVDSEIFETYRGSRFFSLRGLMVWGLIAVFLLIPILNPPVDLVGYRLIIVVCFGWYAMGALWMYFFKVSPNYLVIRNQQFFWIKKTYRLADIVEVVFERQGNYPNGLRVITRDFKTKLFYAGSLTDKAWLKLGECLEDKGIKVRNECI